MSSREKYEITKFTEQNYTQIAVDFIINHPGCTAAFLLSKEHKRIGRKRFYQTLLPTLKRKKIIREEKVRGKRGRDIRFYIREDNPLDVVSRELSEFEKHYSLLLTKVKEHIEKWQSGKHLLKPTFLPRSKGKSEYEYGIEPPRIATELIADSTLLLFETMRTNILRTVMIWSRLIEDRYTREMLNFMVFSKLYQMQFKISEILGDVTILDKNALILSVGTELSEIKERIQRASHNLDRFEIKNEIEPILAFVNKTILTEMARYQIYSKSNKIKWNINDSEVQELAEKLSKENPTRSEKEIQLWDSIERELDIMRGK